MTANYRQIAGRRSNRFWWMGSLVALGLFVAAACSGGAGQGGGQLSLVGNDGGDDESRPTLVIGGIPDQNASTIERQFSLLANYLEAETGLDVEYQPSVDYAAIVTAFRRGDIQLGWFGGLTGVQARSFVEDAQAIAQRPRDAEFHSVFIARTDLDIANLDDLRGRSFTFGSESSTSGHLMPRSFLSDIGIDPDRDFDGLPNFSGSHDTTYKLVEAGAFDAGALNEAVWERAVSDGLVDFSKVRAFFTTPPYFDYHFIAQGDLDEEFGSGTTVAIADALFRIADSDDPDTAELLDLFATDGFVATVNANYNAIESVAQALGIVR
jgi:phosphonate transport system substrate-binding protein